MYVKITDTIAHQYSAEQLRRDNPQVSFPKTISDALLTQWGVHPVKITNVPPFDALTHFLKPTDPYQVNGQWQAHYYPEQLSKAQAEANIRVERDRLLASSDWTQMQDSPADKAVWAVYRQALRDVPQQEGFPFSVSWPAEPI